jgi:hypothetical protein
MPTKRTTKRTAPAAATTPMTVADAFEAGRRAYEAAAGSTGMAAPTADPRRALEPSSPLRADRLSSSAIRSASSEGSSSALAKLSQRFFKLLGYLPLQAFPRS